MPSLYDRVGGEAAIFAAVDGLYRRIMDDPSLRGFFTSTDMDTQTKKMVGFLAHAFGGPHDLKGRDLRTAHSSLVQRGLTHSHFDAVLDHLRTTLRELGLDPTLVTEVVDLAESTRRDVLGLPRG